MSSVCDVSSIDNQMKIVGDDSVSFESYLLKAASKAFSKVFPEQQKANVSRVVSSQDGEDGLQYYQAANDLRLSQLGSNDLHEGLSSFSAGSPPSQLTISQVNNSWESLPIVSPTALISLHFTQPQTQVLAGGAVPGETFDIETIEDEDLDYNLQLKIGKTSKISISYDIQKIDEQTAAKYMSYVKTYLDDPDMLLL